MSDKAIPEFAPFGYTLARRMAALLAGTRRKGVSMRGFDCYLQVEGRQWKSLCSAGLQVCVCVCGGGGGGMYAGRQSHVRLGRALATIVQFCQAHLVTP